MTLRRKMMKMEVILFSLLMVLQPKYYLDITNGHPTKWLRIRWKDLEMVSYYYQ